MKKFVFLLLMAIASANVSHAQNDGRFGNGAHGVENIKLTTYYTDYLKEGKIEQAYPYWKKVFESAPFSQVALYTNGAKILSSLIQKETSPIKRKEYLNELMDVYDKRLANLDKLNLYTRKKTKKGFILGRKAHDYITYSAENYDLSKAYDFTKSAVENANGEGEYFVIQEFLDTSSKMFRKNQNLREQFINDYSLCCEELQKAKEGVSPEQAKDYRVTSENLDAILINSGAADCEHLKNIYSSKIEQNKEDVDFLKKTLAILRMSGCTDSETYFKAAELCHKLNPTAESALGCGAMCYKKGDNTRAIEFMEQAVSLENDKGKKAEYCYSIGAILLSHKQYAKAKAYATKALSFRPQMGKAYMLSANAVIGLASSKDPVLHGAYYCLATDKLVKAKTIDPSLRQNADSLISRYRAAFPKRQDVFMNPAYKEGQRISVLGESTILRVRPTK